MKTNFLFVLLFLGFGFAAHAQSAKYTMQVKNLVGAKPSVDDFKNGKIHILFFLNEEPTSADFSSCKIVHVPKLGEMAAPTTFHNDGTENALESYLMKLKLGAGDRLFLEDITIHVDGKEMKAATGVSLLF